MLITQIKQQGCYTYHRYLDKIYFVYNTVHNRTFGVNIDRKLKLLTIYINGYM